MADKLIAEQLAHKAPRIGFKVTYDRHWREIYRLGLVGFKCTRGGDVLQQKSQLDHICRLHSKQIAIEQTGIWV